MGGWHFEAWDGRRWGLAVVAVAVRVWRWLRSPGWTEDIEAVYGPRDGMTSGERITRTGVTTYLSGGGGGHTPI